MLDGGYEKLWPENLCHVCSISSFLQLPSDWHFGFLAIILDKVTRFARFCKIFQDRGEKSKKIFGLIGKKTKNIQDLGRNSRLSKFFKDLGKKTKTPSFGWLVL